MGLVGCQQSGTSSQPTDQLEGPIPSWSGKSGRDVTCAHSSKRLPRMELQDVISWRVGFSEVPGLGQHDRGMPTTPRIPKTIRILQGGTMYEVTEWGALLLGRAGKTSDGCDKGVGPGVLDMHSL